MRTPLPLLLALLALPAAAQERLALGPGHTLRLHPSALVERPVDAAYAIDLAAGDWLLVTAPAAQVNGASTEPRLALAAPDGTVAEDAGRLVHRAAAAGTYRLSMRQGHAIALSRYPQGHPVIDPGLRVEDVRYEARGLGGAPRGAIQPPEPRYDDVPPPSGTPARVNIELGDTITLRLYRREALRQMDLWQPDPTQHVLAFLEGTGAIEPGPYLPVFPAGEGMLAYTARAERLRGACFRTLRYLAFWTQEDAWPFDRLHYFALGISQDGRYLLTLRAETQLARAPGEPAQAREGRNPHYEAALTRRLQGDPAALTPRLSALDALVNSVTLPGCGRP
jgi:hypothetical protein